MVSDAMVADGWQATEFVRFNEDGTTRCWINRSPFDGKWRAWRRPKRGPGWVRERTAFAGPEEAIVALKAREVA